MYLPCFLSMHGSPVKCKGKKDLQRWESAKRRQIQEERAASASPEQYVQEELPIDAIITTETQKSLGVQTA